MGDTLYVGSCNGGFRALLRSTGKELWATRVAPDSGKYFFHGDPLVTPDLVVAGADAAQGHVHAFDRSTGRERWKYSAGRGVFGAVSGSGRAVYAIASDGRLLSLDLDSGRLRWSLPLEAPGWEAPAVAGARVFAGSRDGWLYALHREDGRVDWQTRLGAAVTTTVGVSGSELYVGTADGSVHRVDARKGAVLSSRKLDASLEPGGVPIALGDSIFVLLVDAAADYRRLVALDRSLERERWRQDAGKGWSTSRRMLALGGMLFVGTASGEVVGYCAADGAPAWSQKLQGRIRAIAGAQDTLYVGTVEGSLFAVRPGGSCPAK